MDWGENRRVLVVDDDESVADVTAEMLAREGDGIETTVATDPAVALDRIESERYDCVVSDYEMPGMDGLALLEAVRDREESLPFVLFTGKGSEEIASEAISAGVTEYLQKGVGTEQYTVLANRVTQAVERHRTERRLAFERERWVGLFDDNPNPVIEASATDARDPSSIEIRDVNAAFEETFGVNRTEVRGQSPLDVLSAPDEEVGSPELLHKLADAGTFQTEVRRETTDGIREFLLTLIELSPPAGPGIGYAVYTDITEQNRRERRIDQLARETPTLIRAENRETAAGHAVDLVADCFDLDLTGLYVREADALVPAAVTDAVRESYDSPPIHRKRSDRPADRLVWQAYETGEPRTILDSRESPLDDDRAALASGAVYPIGDHGVLLTGSEEYAAVDETTESLLEMFTMKLTATFDRLDHEQVVTTLQGAAREIGACASVSEACERTVTAAQQVLGFEYPSVDLAKDDRFVPIAFADGIDVAELHQFEVGEGLLGETYRRREPILVADAFAHEHAEPRDREFRSAVSVPVGDHGVFQAVAREFDAFDERDLDRAESLAAHLARTLTHLRDARPTAATRQTPDSDENDLRSGPD